MLILEGSRWGIVDWGFYVEEEERGQQGVCVLFVKPKHSFVPQFQFGVIIWGLHWILGKGKERETKEAAHLIDSVSGEREWPTPLILF